MQTHTIVLNISRGPVIDEKALAHALHQGHIGGAGIDVYEFEPPFIPTYSPRRIVHYFPILQVQHTKHEQP